MNSSRWGDGPSKSITEPMCMCDPSRSCARKPASIEAQPVHQLFPGRGNWVPTNRSQPRSGNSARCVSRIRADAVTG